MAQDYKHTVSRQKPRAKGSAPVPIRFYLGLGFVAGLSAGLLVAFLIYLVNVDNVPPTGPENRPEKETRVAEQPAQTPSGSTQTSEPAQAPPRFEFYTILPEREVVIPDAELLPPSQKQEGSPTVSEPVQVKDPRQYVLQAGSFRQSQDAETLRARIALLGVEATIQPVTLNQGERWHRVRIGPLSTLDELNRVRRRLDENGIGVLLVRQS